MGFFGSKPKLRQRAAGFSKLSGALGALDAERAEFTGIADAGLRDLAGGRTSDRRALVQAKAADAQFAQKGQAVGANDITENAIRRAKGLSGVVNATNTEFDQRLLQDRIASTGGAMRRRGQGLRQLSQAGNLQDALTTQQEITANTKSDIRSEQLGALTGAVAGAISPKDGDGIFDLFKKKPPGQFDNLPPGSIQKPGKAQQGPTLPGFTL